MQHTISYHPYRTRSNSHRKRIIFWAVITILSGASGFTLGSAIESINQQSIEASYRRQIDDLEAENSYLRALPAKQTEV